MVPTSLNYRLLTISTGQCQPLLVADATRKEIKRVVSGIRKSPISSRTNKVFVYCGLLGLESDEHADLSVHGGREKAIYCYPHEHYDYWQKNLTASPSKKDRLLQHGALGENFTTLGLAEDTVYLGDLWKIDEVILQVTLPRQPCFKLNAVMGDPEAAKKMLFETKCGWYLTVIKPGFLSADTTIEIKPGSRDQTVKQAFLTIQKPSFL